MNESGSHVTTARLTRKKPVIMMLSGTLPGEPLTLASPRRNPIFNFLTTGGSGQCSDKTALC